MPMQVLFTSEYGRAFNRIPTSYQNEAKRLTQNVKSALGGVYSPYQFHTTPYDIRMESKNKFLKLFKNKLPFRPSDIVFSLKENIDPELVILFAIDPSDLHTLTMWSIYKI